MTRLSREIKEIKKEGKKGDKTVEIPLQLVKTNDSFSCPAVSLKCLHHFTKSTPDFPQVHQDWIQYSLAMLKLLDVSPVIQVTKVCVPER